MLNVFKWVTFGYLVLNTIAHIYQLYESAGKAKVAQFFVALIGIPVMGFAAWYLAAH